MVPPATPRRDVRSRATWGSRGHWRLMGGHRPRSAVLVAGYQGADLISPTVNFRATIPSVNDRVQPDTGAMSTLQSWAQCSIIAVAKPGACVPHGSPGGGGSGTVEGSRSRRGPCYRGRFRRWLFAGSEAPLALPVGPRLPGKWETRNRSRSNRVPDLRGPVRVIGLASIKQPSTLALAR